MPAYRRIRVGRPAEVGVVPSLGRAMSASASAEFADDTCHAVDREVLAAHNAIAVSRSSSSRSFGAAYALRRGDG